MLSADAFPAWFEAARRTLLADGYYGAYDALIELPCGPPEIAAALNYLLGHRDRFKYARRLSLGQSIDSGEVEGTIKQRVNLRMKRTDSRCWRIGRMGPFVEFQAMADTPEWDEYWTNVAA